MTLYRRKRPAVEAERWDGHSFDKYSEREEFAVQMRPVRALVYYTEGGRDAFVVPLGDWIVRWPTGYDVLTDEEFQRLYEPVTAQE